MKKKLTAVALVVCMLAIMLVGASLAYFTDTDSKDNVFTTGKVDIMLNETFVQNSKLLPGYENAVTKEVSVYLESGSEDAYVWYEYLMPQALEDVVLVNCYGDSWDEYYDDPAYSTGKQLKETWDHTYGENDGIVGTETINGVVYNKHLALYHGILSYTDSVGEDNRAGILTSIAMCEVYMSEKVDVDAQGNYTLNGQTINFDFSNGITIPVRAYGIQAAGFADVYAAYTAYQNQK